MHGLPYTNGLPWDASAHGGSVDSLINFLHVFMALLFVGWGIFFVMCLVKFRRRDGHKASHELPAGKASKYAEIIVGIVEVVLLVGFSIPAWAAYKDKPPPFRGDGKTHAADEKLACEVRAVGEQFQWNFHYPGKDGVFGRTRPELVNPPEGNPLGLDESDPAMKDDIVSPELHVPFDKDVYVRISSKDVIHSFFIPIMRVKQDAIPGMLVPVWFKASKFNTDDMRKALTRKGKLDDPVFIKKMAACVAMTAYKGKDGAAIVNVGEPISDDALAKLKAAGIAEVDVAPKAAAEVVCAQLCGGDHYRMKAPFYIDTDEQYAKWLASQSAAPATDEKKQPEGDFQS